MDLLVVYLGFAAIAGLISGYLLGRWGSSWSLPALWGATALVAMIYAVWMDSGSGPQGAGPVVILYAIIGPFAISAVLAGLLGVAVRVLLSRRVRDDA